MIQTVQTDWASKVYLRPTRKTRNTLLRWTGAALFVIFWLGLFNLGSGI